MLNSDTSDHAENVIVGLSANNMKRLELEEGSPVLLIGKKQMKSVGVAVEDTFIKDKSISLHESMLSNLRYAV